LGGGSGTPTSGKMVRKTQRLLNGLKVTGRGWRKKILKSLKILDADLHGKRGDPAPKERKKKARIAESL